MGPRRSRQGRAEHVTLDLSRGEQANQFLAQAVATWSHRAAAVESTGVVYDLDDADDGVRVVRT